ncbi:hypothetical protein M9978_16330 [Sphingomonas sp. MG17]|uniref:Uncharacterized protein n=1 Tax=Sphingomonas tagetis TaxID=2949092 RepID=A0A9X2HJG8_9SPHN|nr:hypothetical protein [Sphingomonas tagetis]MCP3731993.1 hypothetical protein [Sphingomonas tagetis]
MEIKKIAAHALEIGTAIAKLHPATAGLAVAAEKVVALVDEIRETAELSPDDARKLEEAREQLEARVNAHADATAANLAD